MTKKYKIPFILKIFFALFFGIIFGIFLHNEKLMNSFLVKNLFFLIGDFFIKIIQMVSIPTIIATLIVGISNVGGIKNFSKVGLKTIFYFEVITTLAILFGLLFSNLFLPVVYKNEIFCISALEDREIKKVFPSIHNNNFSDMVLSLVPSNIFLSLSYGDILPIIFFVIFFGLGLSMLDDNRKKNLVNIFESISEIMFNIVGLVTKCAPIGVFSLVSKTVAIFGFSSLFILLKLIFLIYSAIILFVFVVLGVIAKIFHFKILNLMIFLKEELILAFSTASSESVFPMIIRKMEIYGISNKITKFVIPIGNSFNLDGSTLYQIIVLTFLMKLNHIQLSISQEIMLILTLMIASKGLTGVPGASFISLLAIVNNMGFSFQKSMILIAGIDRILDMARTALNVIGNSLAVLIIAKWENQYQPNRESFLSNKDSPVKDIKKNKK